MKIIRFECDQVHGYLSFSIDFRPDLTFLTGINGSGKTTAVRAITALLMPSLRELANFTYRWMRVSIEFERQILEIASERTEEEIIVSVTGVAQALRIPILKSEAYEPRSQFWEREHQFYREQEAMNVKHPVLTKIESLPTPMFLDLERRHQGGTKRRREDVRVIGRAYPANPLAGSLLDSLLDAQSLAEQTYRRILAERTQLTDRLKEDIILTAFDPNVSPEFSGRSLLPNRAFVRQIQQNELVVDQVLTQIGIPRARIIDTVEVFFGRVREVAQRLPSEKELRAITTNASIDENIIKTLQEWSAIEPQVHQINRLVRLIEQYNAQVLHIFKPIEQYLNSLNDFFAHSGKRVVFDASGSLGVWVEDKWEPRPITGLSSGERQIVVILTHLSFNRQAQRANVLIIDEPELSLHLRWQELFVDAVTAASPNLQLILATHSPSIIRSRVENCVDIEEARHGDRILT